MDAGQPCLEICEDEMDDGQKPYSQTNTTPGGVYASTGQAWVILSSSLQTASTRRFYVTRFVPQSDCRLGQIVLVAKRAQARGAEQEMLARRRFESEPAGGEHAHEMTARKQQHVAP